MNLKHHFHRTGAQKQSVFPMLEVICCFCGGLAYELGALKLEGGCGKFAPAEYEFGNFTTTNDCPVLADLKAALDKARITTEKGTIQ